MKPLGSGAGEQEAGNSLHVSAKTLQHMSLPSRATSDAWWGGGPLTESRTEREREKSEGGVE